eukprot:362177-Chlamydomonas_euryale.AAC.4
MWLHGMGSTPAALPAAVGADFRACSATARSPQAYAARRHRLYHPASPQTSRVVACRDGDRHRGARRWTRRRLRGNGGVAGPWAGPRRGASPADCGAPRRVLGGHPWRIVDARTTTRKPRLAHNTLGAPRGRGAREPRGRQRGRRGLRCAALRWACPA